VCSPRKARVVPSPSPLFVSGLSALRSRFRTDAPAFHRAFFSYKKSLVFHSAMAPACFCTPKTVFRSHPNRDRDRRLRATRSPRVRWFSSRRDPIPLLIHEGYIFHLPMAVSQAFSPPPQLRTRVDNNSPAHSAVSVFFLLGTLGSELPFLSSFPLSIVSVSGFFSPSRNTSCVIEVVFPP